MVDQASFKLLAEADRLVARQRESGIDPESAAEMLRVAQELLELATVAGSDPPEPVADAFHKFRVMPAATALDEYLADAQPKPAVERLRSTILEVARTAIVELDYVDIDYSAAFQMQLSRAFASMPRTTTRLHFFQDDFSMDLLRSLENASVERLQRAENYLGFIVLRPTVPQSIGRTFIGAPTNIDGSRVYFPTSAKRQVNICGMNLEVNSCPYLSQDGMVMACATAAVWMASTPLAPKLGYLEHSTARITSMARGSDRPFTPTLGKNGLDSNQMDAALTRIGYEPRQAEWLDSESLMEFCYAYVESGMPVILLLESRVDGKIQGHAVTVVGHACKAQYAKYTESLNRSCDPDLPISPRFFSTSSFVPALVVHDDQRGPYLSASIVPVVEADGSDKEFYEHGYRSKVIVGSGTEQLVGYCQKVIVPTPDRVMVDVENALALVTNLLHLLINDEEFGVDPGRFAVRTMLVRSNVYKETLLTREDMSPAVRNIYRAAPMPRFIWVNEIGWLDDWEKSPDGEAPVIGEFIFDTTTPVRLAVGHASLIAAHTPGRVCVLDHSRGEEIHEYAIDGDASYRTFTHLMRP